MRTKEDILHSILDCGLIAIVRLSSAAHLERVAECLVEGGISVVEFTMNTPGALEALSRVRKSVGDDFVLGAGTVLDVQTARAAMRAGAEFIVSPNINPEVVSATSREERVSVPGAFTPTEVWAAMEAGADLVKLFPANFLGPDYLRTLRAPLSDVRLVPTGGVDTVNMKAYLDAGASALGVGSSLVNDARVSAGEFTAISESARRYREAYDRARDSGPA